MYEQFYGLTGRPFQLTPDPEFYFESASHKKAMSYLGYGLQQGEGFVVITGEIGAGKSTLVAHLMQCIDPAELTVAQVVTSALDGEELVHVVAQSFGLAVDGHDKAGALGAIEYFLGEEARAGRRCLLVVDESQNLDIGALEELRMLSNFQLGSYPLLQTLLLGQPEFRSLLANSPKLEQLRQRIIASHHLSALKPEEVQNYVEHRMEHVGWAGRPSFADGFHASLYQATGGIPRRVNQVMNRMLLLGAIEEREEFTSQMLATVMAEMAGDASASAPNPVPPPQPQRQVVQPKVEVNPADDAAVASMLAERDTRIAELEQAVDKLHRAAARPVAAEVSASSEELADIRQRLDEQEHSLRHILTMLIEFFEDSTSREAA